VHGEAAAVAVRPRQPAGAPGRAVQVDPIKTTLKPSGTKRLKLKHDELLSNFGFECNLRRYTLAGARLTIPHAVLCSEMGAHFSPCGKRLAACVACVPRDAPPPTPGQPIPHLVYELRIYSVEAGPGYSFHSSLSSST
jgi:hypothetical protein